MTTLRASEKERLRKQRKHTAKLRLKMDIISPGWNIPQHDIIHHPRAFNKPLSCMSGKHKWSDKVVMGVPFLYCIKCGAGIPRDSYYDVLTEREKRANVPDPTKNINKTDWITEFVEEFNARSKK